MFRHHPVLTLITTLYLGAVAWLTLGPQPTALVRASGLYRILRELHSHPSTAWVTYSFVQYGSNLLMFLPVGVFLVLLFGRRLWWFAVIMGTLLSASIEFTQLFIPGRVSDVRDLMSNSLGTLIGVLVALILTWPAAARRRRDALLAHPRTGGVRTA